MRGALDAGGFRGCGPRRGAVAALDQRLADGGGTAQSSRLRHRPARGRGRESRPPAARCAVSCPRCGSRHSERRQRVRLDAVQGALPLPRMRSSPSTTSSACEMLKFHSLQVLQVRPTPRTRWRSRSRCPPALRGEYHGSPGSTWWCAPRIDGRGDAAHLLAGQRAGRVAAAHRAARARARAACRAISPSSCAPAMRSRCCRRTAASRRAHAAAAGATPTWPSPPAAASRRCCRWCARCWPRGDAGHPVLRQQRHGPHHVPRGAAGAQGPPPRAARAALRDEPRAAGGRALQRPDRCGARAPASRATLFEPRAVREYFVCGPGDMIER